MPILVHNYMKIAGAAEEIERFKKTCITGEGEDGLDFNAIIPMPAEVQDGILWACANWGTKWNVHCFSLIKDEATRLECIFDTAWSPPEPVWKKMGEMFPTLDFELGGSNPTSDYGFEGGIRNGQLELREIPLIWEMVDPKTGETVSGSLDELDRLRGKGDGDGDGYVTAELTDLDKFPF
jgi:hypothetical protein